MISSGITGVAGAILYLNYAYIRTDGAFSMNWTIACVFIVIIVLPKGIMGLLQGKWNVDVFSVRRPVRVRPAVIKDRNG